ncbi:MAG: dGTPase [Sphingomonas sp.]|uniref:anti-phage deoxyguanosine triphosphatase n=1 Tax=Sphingomonas sp. TaxID=28214 RepID=UPI0025F2C57A|nr:anti-phage deoxyguanosine triphosphatase [Sphingomonas sp.]MBQ1500347.1 dGTPase [Sphingomonas sp.]MBQ8104237.1 dGTPase [Afipia sp.]
MSWLERRENWNPQREDARDDADIDYARIIHSSSFRRLQGKTQILNLGDSDFYRTRLTHSLEVAQIAGGIARQFAKDDPHGSAAAYLPSLSLIQAAGATHDLGHPPFGHGGEVALNYCMRDHGGFEGNGQTLRIVSRLEKFSDSAGANLTRRTLLSLLKYPVSYSRANNLERAPSLETEPKSIRIINRETSKPPKCFFDSEQDVVDWILQPLGDKERELFTSFEAVAQKHNKAIHKSFDCSIMDLADDIAFGVHDLEDALNLNLIEEKEFRRIVPEERCTSFLDKLKEKYPEETGNNVYETFVDKLYRGGRLRKRYISRMVHHLITSCRIREIEGFDEPLVRFRAYMEDGPAEFLSALKDVVRERVILDPSVQQLEFKGQRMVVAVFEAFSSEPKSLLPRETYARWELADDKPRVICDHIAGMTDSFLLKTYDRFFSPRMGSVFDRI